MIRRGMTLIELLLAVTLSAMLLAALIGLLRGTSNQTKIASTFDQPIWQTRVPELIRADLAAADAIWSSKGRVFMQSSPPPYHDRKSGLRLISYRCDEIETGSWALIRSDEDTQSVLAMGPERIVVERVDQDGFPQPLPSRPGPVNRQFRVWVYEHGRAVIDRTMTL